MVYHPVVIDHCWAWHAGYLKDGSQGKNGNGFKLGGWGATAQKSGVAVGNHEFLSPDKDGYREPDTDFNSWTTLDGCSPIKEGYKEGKTQTVTKEHGRYDSRCQRTGRH